jgi:hypothetical protein
MSSLAFRSLLEREALCSRTPPLPVFPVSSTRNILQFSNDLQMVFDPYPRVGRMAKGLQSLHSVYFQARGVTWRLEFN